jgi:hypothetical protein
MPLGARADKSLTATKPQSIRTIPREGIFRTRSSSTAVGVTVLVKQCWAILSAWALNPTRLQTTSGRQVSTPRYSPGGVGTPSGCQGVVALAADPSESNLSPAAKKHSCAGQDTSPAGSFRASLGHVREPRRDLARDDCEFADCSD